MNRSPMTSPTLLTPRQAAQRLLEEAALLAFRTNGAAGLRPVRDEGRLMYRLSDVEGLLQDARGAR